MKTAVGLFDEYADACSACTSLQSAGFPRDDLGLLATEQAWDRTNEGAGLEAAGQAAAIRGAVGEAFGGLLVGVGALAMPGIGPIVASGPVLATLTGANNTTAGGGILEALTRIGIPKDHAEHYAEGVRRGGTLVMVHASDDLAPSAADLLEEAGALDVEKRAGSWRQSGYRGYDRGAPGLTAHEIARERASTVAEPLEVGAEPITGKARIYPHLAEEPVEERASLRDQRA